VPPTVSIAESGSLMAIPGNTDDGIDVDPNGSSATIDETNIMGLGNGGQDIEQ